MQRKDVRVLIPTEFSEDEIAITANNFFWHFANDLGAFINTYMSQQNGIAWLQELKTTDAVYRTFNLKDPAALLKDLAKFGGSKLRPAINSIVEKEFLKEYYDDLDALLGERNAWYHRQVPETTDELLDLISTIIRASQRLNLQIVEDCKAVQQAIIEKVYKSPTILKLSDPESVVSSFHENQRQAPPSHSIDAAEIVATEVEKVTEVEVVAEMIHVEGNEMIQIGNRVSEKLLSHSYVLHASGEIRNRLNDELLSEVNPESAVTLGSKLIARKPSGGRLRVTEEGVLCAFFGEKWGYLAKVKPEEWFPDHLQAIR